MPENFAHLSRARLEERIVQLSAPTAPYDVRVSAIRAVNDFNDIALVKLAVAEFNAAVVALTAKLRVAQPVVPQSLSSLSDAEAVALAQQLELANWDRSTRSHMVYENQRYWIAMVPVVAPTLDQYRDQLITMMNYARAERGLPAIA